MSKYTVAGVSTLNGETKVRFAHDLMYVKGLAKAGNTGIELLEAPSAMEKPELAEWLKTTPLYEKPEFKEVIDERCEMYAKIAKSKAGTVKTKTVKVAKTKPVKAEVSKESKLAEIAARAKTAETVEAVVE